LLIGIFLERVYSKRAKGMSAGWAESGVAMNTATIRFFHRAIEPDSLIAVNPLRQLILY